METTTDPKNKPAQQTGGELLPDGNLLEEIRDPSNPRGMALLRWDGERAEVADRIVYAGRTYIPMTLNASTLEAIYFPSERKDHGSLAELFAKLVDVINSYFSLPDRELRLIAHFILTTWVADALPKAVRLLVSGPSSAEISQLFRLLRCLCRHAVRLGDVSRSGLCALPMELGLCLLMEGVTLNRSTRALIKASGSRGSFILQSGNFIDLHCAKALSFENDEIDDAIAATMLRLNVLRGESQYRILNATEEKQLADEFQPLLLDYRLKTYKAVRDSTFDVPQFTPEIREIAVSLGATVVGDAELISGIVPLLTVPEEESRARRSVQPEFVIVMALLALVHERKEKTLRVTEITRFVNAALQANGESVEYSPKEIGWRFTTLGIHTRRMQGGKGVLFNREFSRLMHHLARKLGVEMSPAQFPQCPDCQPSAETSDIKVLV
jgi:hypothetical protein